MAKLSAKHESFIQLMKKSEEHARKGFELLVARPEPEFLFDALDEAGLFSPDNNLAPVPADDPNYFRIPYWSALDYLEVVARRAGENRDPDLSQKVMAVVRNVTENTVGGGADNYHTWRKFAEIVGLLPSEVVTVADMEMLPVWLQSKFDTGGVAHALDQGVLKQYLTSDSADDWGKACRVLFHCTVIRWEDDGTDDRHKPSTVIDSYGLKELINNHSKGFGAKCGANAAEILKDRVRIFFKSETASLLTRPAVEDHSQNHDWEDSANALVEGLRDVLLQWSEIDSDNTRDFIGVMLTDDNDMIRRIGIYVLDQRWLKLSDLFNQILGPDLFTSSHIHELYNLLKNNFTKFDADLQKNTNDVLRRLPEPVHSDDPERALKVTQRQWLSAVVKKDCEIVDRWYVELNDDPALGALSSHPDFHYYTESYVGTGSSPYGVAELIGFTEQGTLIDKLNNFVPTDSWKGSSKKSLVDTLGKAVQQAPDIFLQNLSKLLDADRSYQYGVINGFKELWDLSKDGEDRIDWLRGWRSILNFIE
ncbi:MAG: hypothetical protein QM501_02310, partial [Gimesia sp.]